MHFIIGIIGTAVALAFFLMRLNTGARALGQGARDAADLANTIGNLPRKLKYRRKAGRSGLQLVEGPVEAATVLMISIARMDGMNRVSDTQIAEIESQLKRHMQLSDEDAADYVLQLRSLTNDLKQHDTALFPMIDILQKTVDKDEAQDLIYMLHAIAEKDSPLNRDQESFISRFRERMGLG